MLSMMDALPLLLDPLWLVISRIMSRVCAPKTMHRRCLLVTEMLIIGPRI